MRNFLLNLCRLTIWAPMRRRKTLNEEGRTNLKKEGRTNEGIGIRAKIAEMITIRYYLYLKNCLDILFQHKIWHTVQIYINNALSSKFFLLNGCFIFRLFKKLSISWVYTVFYIYLLCMYKFIMMIFSYWE